MVPDRPTRITNVYFALRSSEQECSAGTRQGHDASDTGCDGALVLGMQAGHMAAAR